MPKKGRAKTPPPEPVPTPVEPSAVEPPAAEPSVRPRRVVYAISVLALVAAAGLGFVKGSWDHRNEPRQMLSDAFARVRDADGAVARVDAAVTASVTVTPAAIRAAERGLPAARAGMLSALDELVRAEPGLEGRDLGQARALRKASEGRLAMLRSAALLLPLQSRASTAYSAAEDAWGSVRLAAGIADEAAQAFNTHDRAGVESSTALTERAESELASAYAALLAASRVMPEAELKPVLDYVAAKRESVAASKRVDAVWLRGDVDEANRMVAELASGEAPLDALLGKLPPSAGVPVIAAFDRLSKELAEDYALGRRLARQGDEALAGAASPHPSE